MSSLLVTRATLVRFDTFGLFKEFLRELDYTRFQGYRGPWTWIKDIEKGIINVNL